MLFPTPVFTGRDSLFSAQPPELVASIPSPMYRCANGRVTKSSNKFKVMQLIGMELEFEPRQSGTTTRARNYFSTWLSKEYQVTVSKVLPRGVCGFRPTRPSWLWTLAHVMFLIWNTLPRLDPNPLLFTLWTFTSRKCHCLRNTYSALPRPSRSVHKLLLHNVPFLQGTDRIVVRNLLILYRSPPPPALPSLVRLAQDAARETNTPGLLSTSQNRCSVKIWWLNEGMHWLTYPK